MMAAQISFFCRHTVGNKKEGSGINANLIREYAVSMVNNSYKEVQKNLTNHMCHSKGTAKLCEINGKTSTASKRI